MNNDLFDKSIIDFIFVYIQVDALSPEYIDFILHILLYTKYKTIDQ